MRSIIRTLLLADHKNQPSQQQEENDQRNEEKEELLLDENECFISEICKMKYIIPQSPFYPIILFILEENIASQSLFQNEGCSKLKNMK